MKKIKLLTAATLVGAAVFGLTSCKGEEEIPSGNNTLDISVVYKSDQGASYKQSTAFEVGGKEYTKNALLPMWEVLADKLDVKINDAGDYTGGSTQNSAESFISKQYRGVNGERVELLMATLAQVQKMYQDKQLISLTDNLDKMPNYKAYLESHPSIANQLKQTDGDIYSAVYFDGVDDVEKYFMISATYVKKLLDEQNPNFDTVTKISKKYTPFNATGKYKALALNADETDAVEIEINYAKNIIETQNNLGELNGKTLTEALRKHIDDTYMVLKDDKGQPLYEKRSDVFLSNDALYNTDDMVALFRCIKANPQLLVGKDHIDVFVPRSNDSNRQRQVMELMQIFGQKGGSAEKERFYFDENGELQDARTQESTYAALNKINELYSEGLIINNYQGTAGQATDWRGPKLKDGTGAVYYDYAQSTAAIISTTGVDDEGKPVKTVDDLQLQAILPPVVKWAATSKDGVDLPEYYHFTEDARSLKTGAWCIPNSLNPDMLDKALAAIDYFYSDEGADLCDFGPNTLDYRKAITQYDETTGKRIDPNPNDNGEDGIAIYKGQTYVVVADRIFDELAARNSGWFEYYTRYVGNSLGFGNIRSGGLEFQFVESKYMKPSMNEISKVVAAEAFLICDTKEHETSSLFFQCVPTQFPLSKDDQTAVDSVQQSKLYESWQEQSKSKSCGYTSLIQKGVSTSELNELKSGFDSFDTNVIEVYRRVYADMNE